MANNYAFDNSIPASSNNPSEDQPLMLTNNQSIQSIWTTDHVGFGTDGGGLHNQVTFATNQSAPSLTADGVSGLFANIGPSLSELFFQNSSVTKQLTGLPVTNSGTDYGIVTPWGITINFGSGTLSGTGTATVTYAIAMTSPFYYAGVTINTGGSAATLTVSTSVNNVGNTSMAVKGLSESAASGKSFYYIAIGATA